MCLLEIFVIVLLALSSFQLKEICWQRHEYSVTREIALINSFNEISNSRIRASFNLAHKIDL